MASCDILSSALRQRVPEAFYSWHTCTWSAPVAVLQPQPWFLDKHPAPPLLSPPPILVDPLADPTTPLPVLVSWAAAARPLTAMLMVQSPWWRPPAATALPEAGALPMMKLRMVQRMRTDEATAGDLLHVITQCDPLPSAMYNDGKRYMHNTPLLAVAKTVV
jgi:hypothetical protein